MLGHAVRDDVLGTVVFDDDDVNDGWYRATAHGFEPLWRRTGFGPGIALFGGILGLIVGSVLLGVVDRVWGPA